MSQIILNDISLRIRRPGKNRKGMSLAEVMFVILLWGVILGILYTFLAQGSLIYNRGRRNVESQQDAFTAVMRVDSCLRETSYKSLMLRDSGDKDYMYQELPLDKNTPIKAFCFLSAKNDNNKFIYDSTTGQPKWQEFVVFYLVDQGVRNNINRYGLYMKRLNPSGSGLPSIVPRPMDSATLTAVISDIKGAQLVSPNILRIEVFEPSLSQMGIQIYTSVDLEKESRVEESFFTTRVFMRN